MSPNTGRKLVNPRARHNFQGRTCSITGVGACVPSRVLTNHARRIAFNWTMALLLVASLVPVLLA